MKDVIQDIGILVPHSVEILQGKPLRLEDFFRRRKAEGSEHAGHELIIGQAVLLAAADVVGLVPEIFRYPVFAYLSQKTARILDCSPLENASHRHMECCRIHNAEDAWIEDAALAQ